MSSEPLTIAADRLALAALELMEGRKVTTLAVIDSQQHIVGVLHLHDLLRAGLV